MQLPFSSFFAKAVSGGKASGVKEHLFTWEGLDRNRAKQVGQMRAANESLVEVTLRRQGIKLVKLSKQKIASGRKVTLKDLLGFTQQLASLIKAGIPLVQCFEIIAAGHPNPRLGRILDAIRKDVTEGTKTSQALRKHPNQFSDLYCDLFEAGEDSGALETILRRLADYQEKSVAIRKKIKGALTYPAAVIVVASVVVSIIMIFVVPVFSKMFHSFGAQLPYPTLVVIAVSNFFVKFWYLILGVVVGTAYFIGRALTVSQKARDFRDHLLLKLPVFGNLVEKGALARWARTMATMFNAGVPMTDALDAVAGAAGNAKFRDATRKIQADVTTGTALNVAMQVTGVFPQMFLMMAKSGEESGSIDEMMTNIADLYENEVDEIAKNLSSLMEPMIIAFLGIIIGGLVVALYMPIFKMGSVVK